MKDEIRVVGGVKVKVLEDWEDGRPFPDRYLVDSWNCGPRPGVPAKIIGIVAPAYSPPDIPQVCFVVRFQDGIEQLVLIRDVAFRYEMKRVVVGWAGEAEFHKAALNRV